MRVFLNKMWENRPLFLRCKKIAHTKLTLKNRPPNCEKFAHPRVKNSPTVFEMWKNRPSKKIAHCFWDVKKSPTPKIDPENSPTHVWDIRPLFLRCEKFAHPKSILIIRPKVCENPENSPTHVWQIRPPTCENSPTIFEMWKIRPPKIDPDNSPTSVWEIRPPTCENSPTQNRPWKFAHPYVRNSPTHMWNSPWLGRISKNSPTCGRMKISFAQNYAIRPPKIHSPTSIWNSPTSWGGRCWWIQMD